MKIFLCSLFALSVSVASSQTIQGSSTDSNPLKVSIIPPHPEAASMGKYVDMPVNLYAGLPQIDIPIYTLKSRELEIPISISFHAGGVKAEEMPSSVGLGWALNAGGVVSRTVRGFEDEERYKGYLRSYQVGDLDATKFFLSDIESNDPYNKVLDVSYLSSNVQFVSGGNCQNSSGGGDDAYTVMHPDYMNIYYASRGGFDFEPDLFFYSLPGGMSAKFMFNKNSSITQVPLKNNTIRPFPTYGLNAYDLRRWTITAYNGHKYYFEERDSTHSFNSCQASTWIPIQEGDYSHPGISFNDVGVISSWKLTSIGSANELDSILFEYDKDELSYTTAFSTTEYNLVSGTDFRYGGSGDQSACRNTILGTEKRLRRITTISGYEVEFVPTSASRPEGGKYISEIIVSFKGVEIKRVHFTYSGMMLTQVQECYPGEDCLPPTTFEYYSGESVLNKESKDVDHWGYYNGAGNESNIPAVIYNGRLYHGANREPNLLYARTNNLKSITHPTKGKTEFDYELNDYSNFDEHYTDRYAVNLDLLSSETFTITSNASTIYSSVKNFSLPDSTEVVFKYLLPNLEGGVSVDCSGVLNNSGASFNRFIYDSSEIDQLIEKIPGGNYTLTSYFEPASFTWDSENPLAGQPFIIEVYRVNRLSQLVEDNRLKGGGLRIKEIRKLDENEVVVLNKKFKYTEENGQSSGKLMSYPSYSTLSSMSDGQMEDFSCQTTQEGTFLVRTANTQIPMALTQGVPVGYDRVTEEFSVGDTLSNGYKVYKFKNIIDDSNGPNVPTSGYGYKNGSLLHEQTYSADSVLLEEVLNEYDSSDFHTIGKSFRIYEVSNSGCYFCVNRKFEYVTYGTPTERFELRTTTRKTFDPVHAIQLENVTNFYYTGFEQIDSLVEYVQGATDPMVTRYTYHNIDRTAVKEKYSYYNKGSGQKLFVSGEKYEYNDELKPYEIYLLEESETPATDPTYSLRLEYTQFDSLGKPLAYKLTDNTTTAIIWDDDGIYPIAEVKFAVPDSVYYEGFENGEGSTAHGSVGNPARTGNRYLNSGSYNFPEEFEPEAGTRLKMSYWYWSSNKWNFSGVIDFNESISHGTRLDEIRVFPEKSEMTTYTYQPGIGITSITDTNQKTAYYQYDELNRLRYILDDKKNVLKKIEYFYKND